MRSTILTLAMILGVSAVWSNTVAYAEPGGCLKYGAGGALAGHFVGNGHAVLGAAGGCAAGMYRRHEARKQDSQQRNDPATQNRRY